MFDIFTIVSFCFIIQFSTQPSHLVMEALQGNRSEMPSVRMIMTLTVGRGATVQQTGEGAGGTMPAMATSI